MNSWNFANVWETVADTVPKRCAQAFGAQRFSWSQFERRADGVARSLLAADLGQQDKVALLLYNGPEYMETAFGALKAGLVPVNTNYRYGPDELEYLWDNADAAAVVFHGELTERVDQVRTRLPQIKFWLHADDGTIGCPDWALPYEDAAACADARVHAPWGRSGEDLVLIYTGGTTGRPKGVMWRQHDLYRVSDTARDPADEDLAQVRERLEQPDNVAPIGLSAAPMMHGTGYVFTGTILSRGGTVVTLTSRSFKVAELLDTIQREHVSALCIVGDAFCLPIVDALDAEPDRWDISSLRAVSSAGMAWSSANKQRLLEYAPEAILVDLLNSSEASGMGRSIVSKRKPSAATRFRLGDNAFVIDEEGREVQPGSGQVGRVAVRGHLPMGYYKDPEKTKLTFPTIRGVRCSVPGDYAVVEVDGTITLLGRGSTSINTAGEKVYPEEVEEALKKHPDIVDALVVGIPDPRFGQVIAAAVVARRDAKPEASALIEHTRGLLARYKAPRHVMLVESLERNPSGKADYPAISKRLQSWVRDGSQPTIANRSRSLR